MGKSSLIVGISPNYKGILNGRDMKVSEKGLEVVGGWLETEYSKSPEPLRSGLYKIALFLLTYMVVVHLLPAANGEIINSSGATHATPSVAYVTVRIYYSTEKLW